MYGETIVDLFYYNMTMGKQRKTKKEKLQSVERKEKAQGFVIDQSLLKDSPKSVRKKTGLVLEEKRFFKADLTKTVILTMLVLALELAIWSYLSRH